MGLVALLRARFRRLSALRTLRLVGCGRRSFIAQRFSPESAGCTEGGEALLETIQTPVGDWASCQDAPADELAAGPSGSWLALWTHSHCEQRVHDQLAQKDFCVFLPKVDVWSRRRGVQRLIQTPMFPGYLFLRVREALDKTAYVEVRKVRGLVRVLGERWDCPAVVPNEEMRAIERVTAAHQRVLPYPYLKEGQRARINKGPLAGIEGILVEAKPRRGLLVLSVHLLQRSVAVVVDGTEVEPTT
jgi:transcription termination/antitermination protein NusG